MGGRIGPGSGSNLWADSRGRWGRLTPRSVEFTSTQTVFGSFGRTREANVETRVDISGYADLLDQFGSEGWELVWIMAPSVTRGGIIGFLLKRPMP